MAYQIEFEEKATADFSKLDGSTKKRIQKYINRIEERDDPRTLGEQLQDNLSAYWKFRVGDYRLIAEIIDERVIVLMLVVAHRREVYATAKKRLSER